MFILFFIALAFVSANEEVPEIMSSPTIPKAPFSSFWTRAAVQEALNNRVVGFDIPSQKLIFDTLPQATELKNSAHATKNRFSADPPPGSRLIPQELYTKPPYAAVGRLIYGTPQNQVAACTAAVVADNVVATAGHCVFSGGWSTNFSFIPHYYHNCTGGDCPGGLMGAKAFVGGCWAAQNFWKCDVAFIVVPGVEAEVGYRLNVLVGETRPRKTYACGYSHNGAGGEEMSCTWNPSTPGRDGNMYIPSKLTTGASGGPWITSLNFTVNGTSATSNLLFGVNSHVFPGKPAMYSPILGSLASSLYKEAVNFKG